MLTVHGYGSDAGGEAAPQLILPPDLAAKRRARMARLDPHRVEDEIGSALETIGTLTRRSALKAGAALA